MTEVTKEGEPLKCSDFVHLHNHTHYSLLDGLTKIPELVDFVKSQGMEAVAVTDHGTMSGLVELYKNCNDAGIKPILGLEAYVAARGREDRDPAYDKQRFHITLLAMNNEGFENLCRLMTEAEIHGKYYKPRIDHEIMERYSEGIICLSGCAGSEISEAIRANDLKKARELIDWYHGIYGDRFYLEMQDHGHPDSPTHWDVQNTINQQLMKFHDETNIPLVVTCDAHYLNHEDQDAHEVLLCVGTASNLSNPNRMSLKDFELHVIPPQEIINRWEEVCPEAVRNSRRIADRCNIDLQLGRILIPKFPVPEDALPKLELDDVKNATSQQLEKAYLDRLVFQGLVYRYCGYKLDETLDLEIPKCRELLEEVDKSPERAEEKLKILPRIDYELSVVDKMGYNGYFLIVQDFINWGKSQRIVYGPGRGSAAGSILAYALRITELDPLKYDLLFERFLNPDRISMPDIDTDIQDTRRDEVIEYCTDKYGKGRVGNIVTFGKMMGKMAVRDVARVMEVPYAEADHLAKLVPDPEQGHHVPIGRAIKEVPELKQEYESNPTSHEVLDFAERLEGTIRSHGVHACGVVIAPDDLVKFLPMEVSAKGPLTTQYPGPQIEELGLLKMDFLGLSNLSVINNALRMIRKVYHEDVDMYALPLDDQKTYELLQRAETTGVFQLESAGMKRYLKDLQANRFEDIIAMVALYRPGPMQFIDSFIRRKHGKEPITYLHPGLENSLKDTYGIMIYQEQFMQISREWCGFTGGQADTLRKAVGKKKVDLMNKVKPQFIEGAIKIGGATEEIAEEFWRELLDFANYCFNKSHAACYGLVAYWTAYLKAHYPDAFMAALMTADMRSTDRLAIEITECKRMGIPVLGPDINESYGDFGIVGTEGKIRFGLSGIKSMGKALVEEFVIPERDKNGPFTSVCDFASRVNSSKFNKKSWEAAIKTGAFDRFGDRSDLLFNLENIQAYGAKRQKDAASGQTDLFGAMGDAGAIPEPEIKTAPTKYSEKEQLLWERDLMGLYISSHPLDRYDVYFEEQTHPYDLITAENDGRLVTLGGIISAVRTIMTKSNTRMAFVKLENKTSEQEVIIFPSLYETVGAKLEQDNVIKVTGRVNAKDKEGNISSEVKVIADTVEIIPDAELDNYQATGQKLPLPKAAPAPARGRRGASRASGVGGGSNYSRGGTSFSGAPRAAAPSSDDDAPRRIITPPKDHRNERLYVLIEDPNNLEILNEIRHLCERNPGVQEVVMVLKDESGKRPIRLPFRVEATDELTGPLAKLLGAACVKVQ